MSKLVLFSILIAIPCFAETIPEMTKENIRWMIPADAWRESKIYALKKFIYLDHPETIKFYSDEKLNGTPVLIINEKAFSKPVTTGCKSHFGEVLFHEMASFKCGYQFCDHGKFNKVKDSFSKESLSLDGCDLPVILSRFSYPNQTFEPGGKMKIYIPLDKGELKKDVLKLLWHGKPIYAKISSLTSSQNYNLNQSLWEKQWLQLRDHQSKKDLDSLNYFIEKLLPCVKAKNKECISKFFLNEELNDSDDGSRAFGDFDRGGGMSPQIITDEIIEELEKCLSYDSLMPHLLSLKGINYACIPFKNFTYGGDIQQGKWDLKFDHVTYPEAVRFTPERKFLYK